MINSVEIADLTYVASIVFKSQEKSYLLANTSWLVGESLRCAMHATYYIVAIIRLGRNRPSGSYRPCAIRVFREATQGRSGIRRRRIA
jgi:hypothetical protein